MRHLTKVLVIFYLLTKMPVFATNTQQDKKDNTLDWKESGKIGASLFVASNIFERGEEIKYQHNSKNYIIKNFGSYSNSNRTYKIYENEDGKFIPLNEEDEKTIKKTINDDVLFNIQYKISALIRDRKINTEDTFSRYIQAIANGFAAGVSGYFIVKYISQYASKCLAN